MRAFLAITPPEEIKSEIEQATKKFSSKFSEISWEGTPKLHLTLAFLGMIPEEKVNTIREISREVIFNFQPFELELGEISYFYKKHEDSVIYIDIIDRDKKLREVYHALRKALDTRDIFLPDRLDPHITIGHAKRTRHSYEVKETLVDLVRQDIKAEGKFIVYSIKLFQSLFSKNDLYPQYNLIQAFSLKRPIENPDDSSAPVEPDETKTQEQ